MNDLAEENLPFITPESLFDIAESILEELFNDNDKINSVHGIFEVTLDVSDEMFEYYPNGFLVPSDFKEAMHNEFKSRAERGENEWQLRPIEFDTEYESPSEFIVRVNGFKATTTVTDQ